jgi:peptide/nickel transport system substrate-binding protein
VRHPVRALVIGAAIVGLAAAGCSKNSGGNSGQQSSQVNTAIIVDYAGTTPTPAPEATGVTKGGTLTILQEGDFEHLSPQQIYVSNALEYSQLFHRMLTGYIEDPGSGPLKLVGDLATNAGVTTDGGKSWKYTLRDGVKWQDGSPVTSKDVAFGIALAFSDFGVQGPQYLISDLDPNHVYKGPLKGDLNVPGVATPDDKTITFTFAEPHTELPYLLAFPTSTPVPQAKFNGAKYETDFQSSGPYMTQEYKKDASLTLVKNPNWDPNTDPIRHQYVDSVKFDFNTDAASETDRLAAATGGDASAIMNDNVPPDKIATVKADAQLMTRVTQGPSPFVNYLYINTQRVTDVDVRRALNYAFDRDAYIKAVGGYDVADPATTLLAPIVPGYKKFDIYKPASTAPNGGKDGDVAKATQLLTGKTVPKLKYCFANTQVGQTVAAVNATGFKRAGFDMVLNPVDRANYYTIVGDKTTDCDIINGGWGEDWPDGEATLGVLMDGSRITPKGNNNLSYLNDPGVNAKLAQLRALPDRGQAAAQYGALDEQIMRDLAPVVPTRYIRNFLIKGPKVSGTFISPLFAEYNITGIYVQP